MTNPVIRPASLSDVPLKRKGNFSLLTKMRIEECELALANLYDAEWRLRGFQRSP